MVQSNPSVVLIKAGFDTSSFKYVYTETLMFAVSSALDGRIARLPPPKCHFPRRKYKTPLASKLPSLAPAFLAPFVGFVGSPDLLDDPSGLFFPGPPSLARPRPFFLPLSVSC